MVSDEKLSTPSTKNALFDQIFESINSIFHEGDGHLVVSVPAGADDATRAAALQQEMDEKGLFGEPGLVVFIRQFVDPEAPKPPLKSAMQKIEEHGRVPGAEPYIALESSEMASIFFKTSRAPDRAPGLSRRPKPPADTSKAAETLQQTPTMDAAAAGDPPEGSAVEWSQRELDYLKNPDITMICAETPEAVPPRVLARVERLQEVRNQMSPTSRWSWMI